MSARYYSAMRRALMFSSVSTWLYGARATTKESITNFILNVVVGIVGASVGGMLISPLFNAGTINSSGVNVLSLLVSLGGAVILLAVVNLFRRGSTR